MALRYNPYGYPPTDSLTGHCAFDDQVRDAERDIHDDDVYDYITGHLEQFGLTQEECDALFPG